MRLLSSSFSIFSAVNCHFSTFKFRYVYCSSGPPHSPQATPAKFFSMEPRLQLCVLEHLHVLLASSAGSRAAALVRDLPGMLLLDHCILL